MSLVLLGGGALLLNAYALLLVWLRAPLFRTRVYRPMVLNVGLSMAPAAVLALVLVALFGVTVAVPSTAALWTVIAVGGLVWLLALPNSAYLITELNFSHRRPEEQVPLWYDIVLVLTLALSGVINTLFNLLLVQTIYVLVARPNDARPLDNADSWVLAVVVLLLVTFGMYLGRYVRFNSWDVFHPGSFVRKLAEHFRRPGNAAEALGFCVAHTVLLFLLYLILMAPAVHVLQS